MVNSPRFTGAIQFPPKLSKDLRFQPDLPLPQSSESAGRPRMATTIGSTILASLRPQDLKLTLQTGFAHLIAKQGLSAVPIGRRRVTFRYLFQKPRLVRKATLHFRHRKRRELNPRDTTSAESSRGAIHHHFYTRAPSKSAEAVSVRTASHSPIFEYL